VRCERIVIPAHVALSGSAERLQLSRSELARVHARRRVCVLRHKAPTSERVCTCADENGGASAKYFLPSRACLFRFVLLFIIMHFSSCNATDR